MWRPPLNAGKYIKNVTISFDHVSSLVKRRSECKLKGYHITLYKILRREYTDRSCRIPSRDLGPKQSENPFPSEPLASISF